MAASNTILQTIVQDEKRGRVMAYYSMAFQGMVPFGSLLAGTLAARIGAPATLVLGAHSPSRGPPGSPAAFPRSAAWCVPSTKNSGYCRRVAAGVQAASTLQEPPET